MSESAGQGTGNPEGASVVEQDSRITDSIESDLASSGSEQSHFNWTKFSAIVAALTLLVALLAWRLPVSGDSDGPEDAVGSTAPASDQGQGSSGTHVGEGVTDAEGVATGTCLQNPEDLTTVVACDASHRAEVISIDDECSEDAAVGYFGGDSDIDVLTHNLELAEVSGNCVASYMGQEVAASLDGALGLDSGVALRECLDGRRNEFVACSEDHTGEVVARVKADSSDSLDCQGKARDYMGESPDKRYDELTVDEVTTDSARRCVVSVRSDNRWMSTSLRAVGSGAIETEPMDSHG